jgi:hypothetical protein
MLPIFWEYSIGTTKLRFILWILAPLIALIWGIARKQMEKRPRDIPSE